MPKKKRGPATTATDTKPIRMCNSNEYVSLDELETFESNPRETLSAAKAAELDASLISLGLFRPLLVWEDQNDGSLVVIGGNQKLARLRSLREAGHAFVSYEGAAVADVPVTYYSGTAAEARLVALRDNNSDGDWDYSALSGYVDDLQKRLDELPNTSNLSMNLAGFDATLLDDLAHYGASDEAKVMEAATRDAAPERPDAKAEKKKREDDARLGDADQQVVGVVIGHIRGRITHATYKRLTAALASNTSQDAGLDVALSKLLDRTEAA